MLLSYDNDFKRFAEFTHDKLWLQNVMRLVKTAFQNVPSFMFTFS